MVLSMSRQKIQRCKAPHEQYDSLTRLSELLADDAAMLTRCHEFNLRGVLPREGDP